MTTIERSALGPLDELGVGGQARIYRATRLSLPGTSAPLVYKEYKRIVGRVSSNGLQHLIAARSALDDERRKRFDQLAAWPLAVVEDEPGRVSGVIMELIPDRYFSSLNLPSGKVRRVSTDIQHLVCDPSRAQKTGAPLPTEPQRRILCYELSYILGMLHKMDIIFGDLNPRNVLYALSPRPSIVMVDCDAARKRGSAANVDQLHIDDWEPPEGAGAHQTVETDLYKLGLAILRILSPVDAGPSGRDPRSAAQVLGQQGTDLLTRSLAKDPHLRTTAKEWVTFFKAGMTPGSTLGTRAMTTSTSAPGGWTRGPDGSWIQV